MKKKLHLAFVVTALAGFALSGYAQQSGGTVGVVNSPEFKNLSDLKWDKILPDLGADSPEISILRVDPKTHATSLLIRTSKAIHVRKHWHTANESHTMFIGTATLACDGKKFDLNPGGFNFMPAKMVHEAWLPRSEEHTSELQSQSNLVC